MEVFETGQGGDGDVKAAPLPNPLPSGARGWLPLFGPGVRAAPAGNDGQCGRLVLSSASARNEDGALRSSPNRRTRRDALPEHTRYADTGCDLHPSCLTCPLARCRYEQDTDAARKRAGRERDRRIIELQRRGKTIGMIASRFGVSRRTVFRVLARERDSTADKERISG
jgi:hypothetical protein